MSVLVDVIYLEYNEVLIKFASCMQSLYDGNNSLYEIIKTHV